MNIYDEAIKETTDFGGFVGLKLDKTLKALERAKKVEELFMVSDEIIYIYELPSINIRNTRRLNELKIKLRKIKGELEEMKVNEKG